MVITLEEIMAVSDALVRQRSTWTLFRMRAVLRAESDTPDHLRRLKTVEDELRARQALR